jgi:HTH-type transcriptional regulator/antitoxin HigA
MYSSLFVKQKVQFAKKSRLHVAFCNQLVHNRLVLDFDPTRYRTPGQLILELLEARGWTQRLLAIILDVDESGLNKLIAGKRDIDASLALSIGSVLEIPAEWLLDLQKTYDLARARILERPDPKRATRAILYGDLPVSEMIKRGWLAAEDVRDTKAVDRALVRFFGVESLDQIEVLPHAAKKTNVSTTATPAQLAWLYRVRQLADEMLVSKYSADSLKTVIHGLSKLLISPDAARKVPRMLTETGVRFVIVEALPSTKIDGVCLWLDDKSPVVGMSTRFDRIDNFWFVLRHELEHVLQNHGRAAAILDTDLEKDRTNGALGEEERIADAAGAEFCVPQVALERFIARKAPYFAERDILGFAATLGIHPGLVAGQLQRKTGRYDLFRNHLVKIRAIVAPGALVDGWGDVAPLGA